MAKCERCGGTLSRDGNCPSLKCLRKDGIRVGGKGSGRGDLNAASYSRQIRSRCPRCIEAKCWPSLCNDDCHRVLAGRNMPDMPALQVKRF